MALKGNVQFGATNQELQVIYTFNYSRITGRGKPTLVAQGVYTGFSLPIFNSDDEELTACKCVDASWDGVSNPTMYIGGWIDTANTTKKFKIQVSWSHTTLDGSMAMDTTTHDVEVEQATGTAAQYTGFKLAFPMDWVGQGVAVGDGIGIRIRRIDASEDEIAGEFVVEGAVLSHNVDKIGAA